MFTVLRDPKERIASFYFYLLQEARRPLVSDMSLPRNPGFRRILEGSADDYFFGGDQIWQNFILDHYDNFYCTYFASRLMRGRRTLDMLTADEVLHRADAALAALQGVYVTDRLEELERAFEQRFGAPIHVVGNLFNIGSHRPDEKRWPNLVAALERDSSLPRLEAFFRKDEALMARAGFAASLTA